MIKLRLIFLSISIFGAMSVSYAQSQEERLRLLRDINNVWRGANYTRAAEQLNEYRKGPWGRLPVVSYMLGTSLCRIGVEKEGYEWLRRVLPNVTGHDKEIVKHEMDVCRGNKEPPITVDIASLGSKIIWRGKDYYSLAHSSRGREKVLSFGHPKSSNSFALSEQNKAIDKARIWFYGPSVIVVRNGHFIIASSSPGHSETQLINLGKELETYLRFYASEFDMLVPEDFITVYLVPTPSDFLRLAENLHSIRPHRSIIGYSLVDDLSIVSITPRDIYGTLHHELFHLLLQGNFGDAPPWLEEGMASLFESSKIEGDNIAGQSNWRGEILRESAKVMKPTINEMLLFSWDDFDATSPFSRATNYATARYFIFYLQEMRKLKDVYFSFRTYTSKYDPRQPAQVLEKSLGKSMPEIESDFKKWLIRNVGVIHQRRNVRR